MLKMTLNLKPLSIKSNIYIYIYVQNDTKLRSPDVSGVYCKCELPMKILSYWGSPGASSQRRPSRLWSRLTKIEYTPCCIGDLFYPSCVSPSEWYMAPQARMHHRKFGQEQLQKRFIRRAQAGTKRPPYWRDQTWMMANKPLQVCDDMFVVLKLLSLIVK